MAFAMTYLMGETGFEPVKAYASRFTVCPLCPLGYSPYSLEFGILPALWNVGKREQAPIPHAAVAQLVER